MAAKKGWPQQLARRFEAVGWEVKLGASGHYKVRTPEGRSMSWPQSPSGTRSQANNEAEARRLGLDAAEQELDRQREAERLARIQQDRQENGVPEERFIAPEPKKEANEEMSKYGFVEVEGTRLEIIEVAKPVMHQHPRGGEPYALPDARELLLVDETLRYQCLKLNPVETDRVCGKHFRTSGGLVVHWARGHRPEEPKPEGRDLGGVIPAERPGVDLGKLELLLDTEPQKITVLQTDPPRPQPEKPGVMARMEDLGQQLLDVHFEAQRLANHAQDLHKTLSDLAKDVHHEIASDELRDKAAKFDAMMGALGQ